MGFVKRSRCGWLVEDAVAEHGVEDVDASSGERDEGGDVVLSLSSPAVVVGADSGWESEANAAR